MSVHTDRFDDQARVAGHGLDAGRVIALANQPPAEAGRLLGSRVDVIEGGHEVGIDRIVLVDEETGDVDLCKVRHRGLVRPHGTAQPGVAAHTRTAACRSIRISGGPLTVQQAVEPNRCSKSPRSSVSSISRGG